MKKALLLAAAPFAMLATPAAAQDSASYVINLNGTVESVCELEPSGATTFEVDMLETGNQGSLLIGYSCNSPYTLTLTSQYGGMRHQQSSGAVLIDYNVETFGFLDDDQGGPSSVNSSALTGAGQVIGSNNDWQNILYNLGARTGNIDFTFNPLSSDYGVAGDYEDTLTITLAAAF